MKNLMGQEVWLAFVALIAVCLALACQRRSEVADLVLRNGIIHTVDANMTTAGAVAVQGDRIAFVGSEGEIDKWIGEDTEVIDLQGRTVVPGFTDSHYHFQGVGKREHDLNLDGTRSLQDFLHLIEEWAATRSAGEWIVGRGWIEEDWPSKTFPNRSDLDAIVPDHPVYLNRADGHMAVVNSKALEIAGIDRTTGDPAGGKILRNEDGEPSGLLIDRAMALVYDHVPTQSPAMQERYAITANNLALAYGLTTIHDAGSSWQTVALWKRLFDEGKMDIRIYCFLRGPSADTDSLLQSGAEIGVKDGQLTVRGIKISIDGALGSRGAALLEDYADANTAGLFLFEDEQIYPTIEQATREGIQVAIHAIGDAANRKVLDLYERALREVPPAERKITEPRHRIEHAQIVHPDDLARFKELSVIPSMQPTHAIGDLHFAIRRLGLERMQGAYAWRTLLDQGCRIASGSDAPVEEGNPLLEFYAAAVRKDTTGFSTDGWHPEMKMTRAEALQSLTIWAAYAAFEEDDKGSIEAGKLADFAVLDRDLMAVPDDELFRIQNTMTIVGGRVVYEMNRTNSTK